MYFTRISTLISFHTQAQKSVNSRVYIHHGNCSVDSYCVLYKPLPPGVVVVVAFFFAVGALRCAFSCVGFDPGDGDLNHTKVASFHRHY